MPKNTALQVLRTDLIQHPAVRAWGKLLPGRVEPECIEIIRERRKSAVYRLKGVGLGGATVIAKRRPMAIGSIERTIYEEVLPHLLVPALHYYGFTKEDDTCCWLFLEDAGSQRFSPLSEEHRALAARWLGLMHTSAARVAAKVPLPDRGPNHYLDHLRSARQAILRNLSNPALTAEHLALLETIVSQCDVLESRWSQVEQWCDDVPPTLVHGDFRPKNVHVRADPSGPALFALDWETAGWGVPAADLAPARGLLPAPQVDITLYWSTVRECWPGLDIQTVHRLATVGGVSDTRLAARSQGRDLRVSAVVKKNVAEGEHD